MMIGWTLPDEGDLQNVERIPLALSLYCSNKGKPEFMAMSDFADIMLTKRDQIFTS